MKKFARKLLPGMLVVGLAGVSGAALGHYSWLQPDTLQAEPGETVALVFGWGHHPGEGNTLEADRMLSLSLWGPEGQWRGLPLHGAERLASGPLEAPGSYLVAAQQSRGYWSRTIEGGRRGSLQEYPNASQCSYSHNSTKALIQVGDSQDGERAVTRPLGQPLEIVPMAVPFRLEDEQALPVQVLLFGAPLADATISVYRQDHSDEDSVATWTTGEDGQAKLKLASGYRWLAHVETSVPFHDSSLCHQHSLNGTLMFAR